MTSTDDGEKDDEEGEESRSEGGGFISAFTGYTNTNSKRDQDAAPRARPAPGARRSFWRLVKRLAVFYFRLACLVGTLHIFFPI